MRLIYLSLTWVVGIYLGSKITFPLSVLIPALASVSLLTLLSYKRRALLWSGLCLLAFLLALLRFQSTVVEVDEHSLPFYNDKGSVGLVGMVAADPDPHERTTQLRLSVRSLEIDGKSREISGSVLLYAPKFPDLGVSRDFPYYRYGDVLKLKGTLEGPPELEDFDYREYLARQGLYSILRYPEEVELVASGQGFKPQEWLYDFRNEMSRSLESALPEPQGSLAKAVILGRRSAIPDEIREDFAETGTAHVLAVSGLHIGIVAGLLFSAGVWLFGRHRPIYFWLALIGIWLYAFLTGMHPPVFRAGIMSSLWLYALFIGRPRSALTALLFAAAVMVGVRPLLLWEVSFQLSFAAMGGLVLLFPPIRSWGRKALGSMAEEAGIVASSARFVIDSASITLSAVLATIPLIAFYFHKVSLVTLPANLFALPALPGVIVTAALVGVLGTIWMPLAQAVGWVCWLFLTYLIKVVQLFAALPLASLDLQVNAPLVLGYYAVLGGALLLGARRKRLGAGISEAVKRVVSLPKPSLSSKWVVLGLAIVAALVWVAALATPIDNRLHVFFLDVGQGDAILLQKGNQQVLVDGGPSPEAINLELGDRLPFWDRTIELVVLTHPQADHLAGLVEVLRRYRVGQVLESGQESDTQVYHEWERLIEERDIGRAFAQAGQWLDLGGGVRLEVLHPPDTLLEGTDSDVNNNSVVLRLVWDEVSFLLTGDLQEDGEERLRDEGSELGSTVLKVAHHGSETSTSAEFLAAVAPQVAVISVAAENRFGHPSPEVMERLAEGLGEDRVYLTSEEGTIELLTDGERLWVRTER